MSKSTSKSTATSSRSNAGSDLGSEWPDEGARAQDALSARSSGHPSGSAFGQALGTSVRFVVAGKGEIHFTLAAGGCISQMEPIYNQRQACTITGGTGVYAGASGSGTVSRNLGDATATGRHGVETWTGTLSVPGLEFDITQPAFTGAVSRTVRAAKGAKSARVSFTVSAQDDQDGARPATCSPRSGSRFPIGKTRVTCTASDTSANTATARFTVTVRARYRKGESAAGRDGGARPPSPAYDLRSRRTRAGRL